MPEAGWAGKKNGELLRLAQEQFDVFVTPDAQLPNQQNLSSLELGIVIVRARSNDIADLLALVPGLLRLVSLVTHGQVLRVSGGPSAGTD